MISAVSLRRARRLILGAALLFALTLPAGAAAPAGSAFFVSKWLDFRLSPEELVRQCARALWRADSALRLISTLPESARTFINTSEALDTALWDLREETAAAALWREISPSPKMRLGATQCLEQVSRFRERTYRRGDLYDALLDYQDRQEKIDAMGRRLLKAQLLDFQRSGLNLPEGERSEILSIRKKLRDLQNSFVRNLSRARGGVLVSKTELEGLPPLFIRRLTRRGEDYRVTTDPGEYGPFISLSRAREPRRLLESLFNQRAPENLPLLLEALDLRYRQARLLKYANYAKFSVETQAAGSLGKVSGLLRKLTTHLKPAAQGELAALALLKNKEEKDSDGVIHAWDLPYYARSLKDKNGAEDLGHLKAFFPLEGTLPRVFKLAEEIFSVRISEVPKAEAWDPSVKLYRVDVPGEETARGFFFVDLADRPGKSPAPRAIEIIKGRRRPDATYRAPVSLLAGAPGVGKNALLDHEDLTALLRATGDIMQQTLSRAPYGRFSGMSVPRDFRETPGRMMESLAWRYEVLRRLSGHREDPAKVLPVRLGQILLDARKVDRVSALLERVFLARLDLQYHTVGVPDTTQEYLRLKETVTLVPMSRGTHPEAALTALLTEGAGLYAGLWADSLAEDFLSRFDADGMTPVTGALFRVAVVEPGSSIPPEDLVKRFLGRSSTVRAFLKAAGAEAKKGFKL